MINDTAELWIIVALAALLIGTVVAIATSRRRSRRRSAELQRQFGPEYDRAVEEHGSPARAERALAARARRVQHFQFHALDAATRARFSSEWSRIQTQFVDDPAVAVASADELINQVMRAQGYPTDDFEQRVADLSVEHPAVVQHYRAAHQLSESKNNGLNTEDLRQAVVHYRVLFSDLLQEPSAPVFHS
jgi:hypothetical protein